jgi:hypothetical protein
MLDKNLSKRGSIDLTLSDDKNGCDIRTSGAHNWV